MEGGGQATACYKWQHKIVVRANKKCHTDKRFYHMTCCYTIWHRAF